MLIVSRREDESVVIGGNIVVTILGIQGRAVRIGIAAPDDVTIDREEIHELKLEEEAADAGALR